MGLNATAVSHPDKGAADRDGLFFRFGLPTIGVIVLLALWWVISLVIGPVRLPNPWVVLTNAVSLLFSSDLLAPQLGFNGALAPQLLISLTKLVIATAIGLVVGVLLGLLMALVRSFGWLIEVPTVLLRAVPPLALVPFILIWMGTGYASEVTLIAFYVALITLANTVNAVQNVPPRFQKFASTLGASRGTIIREVVLRAIGPEVLASFRITMAFSWGLLVVAESLGGTNGVGQALTLFVSVIDAAGVMAAVLWVVVLALLIDGVLALILARTARWTDKRAVA